MKTAMHMQAHDGIPQGDVQAHDGIPQGTHLSLALAVREHCSPCVDSDFAADPDTSRSVSSCIMSMNLKDTCHHDARQNSNHTLH